MIKMAMREHHIVDTGHLIEREIPNAGTRIDKQIRVDQERGRAAVLGNGA
jgi:hypothetical protein